MSESAYVYKRKDEIELVRRRIALDPSPFASALLEAIATVEYLGNYGFSAAGEATRYFDWVLEMFGEK